MSSHACRSPSDRRARRYSRSPSRSPRRRDRYEEDRHDRHHRHRERSRERGGHYRRHRRRSDSDSDGGYGYRPRQRQIKAPAFPGPGVGPDPYAALRLLNASSLVPSGATGPGDLSQENIAKAWQEQALKARQLVLQQQALSAQMAASRSIREIHIGNLAPGQTTQDTLKQIFNTALAVRFPSLSSPELGPAVVRVNVHTSQKFAFMELRTPEFATAALDLNGQILLPGAPGPMTVNRPSTYVDPSRALVAAAAAAQTLSQFPAQNGPSGSDMLAPSTAVAQSVASALGTLPGPPSSTIDLPGPPSGSTSSFIRVAGMLTAGMPKDEVDETMEDLREECLNHGPVSSVKLVGTDLLVRFDSPLAASSASTAINGRLFDGRQLAVVVIAEPEFLSN